MRRVLQAVKNASKLPQGVFPGRLAEDYDGIGQYVRVQLAQSSVNVAYKARVAAGDFGGGRRIPAGTKVTIVSYRGSLEVLLGNQPQVNCDLFNRTTTFDTGGWGVGPLGRWYGPAEYYSKFFPALYEEFWDVGETDAPRAWVQDGKGYFGYVWPFVFTTDDPVRLLPIKKQPRRMVVDFEAPHIDTEWGLILYFGNDFYYVNNTWITLICEWFRTASFPTEPERLQLFWDFGSETLPPDPWHATTGVDYQRNINQADAHHPWRIAMDFDTNLWTAKIWRPGLDPEPSTYQATQPFTIPADPSYFKFFYIENQSGTVNGFSAGPQEAYEVAIDKVCIYY